MKKILILLILMPVMFSCKKAKEELLTFTVRENAEFYVEPFLTLDLPLKISNIPVQVSAKQAFEQQGMDPDHIEKIILSEAKLVMVDPEQHNFNFIKDINVSIHGHNNPEVDLAFHNNIPLDHQQVDLETTGNRMDQYLKEDSFMINIESTTREVLTERVLVRAEMVFRVTGKVFK